MTTFAFHTVLTSGFISFFELLIRSHSSLNAFFIVDFIGTKAEYDEALVYFTRINQHKFHIKHIDLDREVKLLNKRWPGSTDLLIPSMQLGKDLCEIASATHNTLDQASREIAVRWKQLVSVEIRYRSLIKEALDFAINHSFTHLVHIDCDMLLINSNLFEWIELNLFSDIGLIYRTHPSLNEYQKIFGCLILFKCNNNSLCFLDLLKKTIDHQDFLTQKRGFGQYALLNALEKFNNTTLTKIQYLSPSIVSSKYLTNSTIYFSGNYNKKSEALVAIKIINFLIHHGSSRSLVNFIIYLYSISLKMKSIFKNHAT